MGESDRYLNYKSRKRRFMLGQPDNALVWLVVFNVIGFLIMLFIKAAISVEQNSQNLFYNNVVPWMHLPANGEAFFQRPWTLITYMFFDVEFFRILSNMLWLWAFGSVLQTLTGNRKIIPVYLYGGFAGALFFLVAIAFLQGSNTPIPANAGLLGANAAIMSVAISATMLSPKYRFFRHIRNGIPLWVLTAVYIFVDLAGVATENRAIPIAHIGGGLAGFLFVTALQNNIDGSKWMNAVYYWIANLFNPHKPRRRTPIKEKVFYDTGSRTPYSKTVNITQQKVDEILDKISQKGFDKLTQEEKEILKKASEN